MEFIYKLLGFAFAAAEEPGVVEGAEGAVQGEVGLLQTIIGSIGMFFPIIIMFVLMYFLMIRPEKKRKKKEKAMLDALKRGDRICTIGGIYGTIMDIKDDTITLSVGRDNLSMVIARWAVRNVEQLNVTNDAETLV